MLDAIAEIQSRPARAWFIGMPRIGVISGVNTPQKGMPGERISRSPVIGGPGHAELEVPGWLETESLPVNDRLWIERKPIIAHKSEGREHELIPGVLPEEEFHAHRPQV